MVFESLAGEVTMITEFVLVGENCININEKLLLITISEKIEVLQFPWAPSSDFVFFQFSLSHIHPYTHNHHFLNILMNTNNIPSTSLSSLRTLCYRFVNKLSFITVSSITMLLILRHPYLLVFK